MNWFGNRYNERYSYVPVSPDDWKEHGEYPYITSGSIELSEGNTLKVSGSFSFNGLETPDPSNMLRIYYSFEDDDGERVKVMLATLFIYFSGLQYLDTTSGMTYSGSMNGLSVLSSLQNKKYGEPFIVKRNENAIYKAASLIQHMNLRVDYTPSPAIINTDHVFDPSTDYLEIINWLCDFAGYREAYPDPEGVIHLTPKAQELVSQNDFTFVNDNNSIMYPEVDTDNNWMERANVVKAVYSTDTAYAIATARNLSGSKNSLASMKGREITMVEEISDFTNKNTTILNNLADYAESLLREEAIEEEEVTISHAYVPINLNDQIGINYSDFTWRGRLDNISIDLSPSTKTQIKVIQRTKTDIEVEKTGEVFQIANGSTTYNSL